jgi:hypothetical protein
MADPIVTLTPVGNWTQQTHTGLSNALAASMNIMNKTGEQACRQAIIFMAQSAGKLAKGSRRKNRQIHTDEHGKYVNIYTQKRSDPYKAYEWMFSDDNMQERIKGTWENAKKIGSKGLAQRSWLWGLKRLGGRPKSAPIAGTSIVQTIRGPDASGYVKVNKLSYILKAMPAGWESMVAQSATNRILKIAAGKMERQAAAAQRRQTRQRERALQSFFKQVAA